jgi:hypothetical protein
MPTGPPGACDPGEDEVLELRVSAHEQSGMLAVGYAQPGAALPTEVRVVDVPVGELIAKAITARLDSVQGQDTSVGLDLDVLVAQAERVLGRARTRRPGHQMD